MALGDMIAFILELKCCVEKSYTYDRKPKKVPKHLNFFHFEAYTF